MLWREPEAETPPELAQALIGRGIGWDEATGPYDAFARLLTSRDRAPARVLLVVEPERLAGLAEIAAALERFDPQVGCWAYGETRSPRLAPFAPSPKPAEPEIVVRVPPKPSNGSSLRLVGEQASAPEPAGESAGASPTEQPEEAAEPQSPRSVLTPEELEMLLADDRP